MSFKEVYNFRFSDNGKFKKDVSVKTIEVNGHSSHYIDIRLKFLADNGLERFTTKGVTLLPQEFEDLLPILLKGDFYEMSSFKTPENYRVLTFEQKTDKPYLFTLRLNRRRGLNEEPKECQIDLTMKEIKELNKIKENVLKACI